MPTLTIIHADGRFKVLKDGEQIRVPMSTGKTLPVEFETREAAEGYVPLLCDEPPSAAPRDVRVTPHTAAGLLRSWDGLQQMGAPRHPWTER